MLHIVCGMIGAGKSTYCKDKDIVSDLEGDITRKSEQIEVTLRMLDEHLNVWHITTYPCGIEEEAFKECEKEYIWINTSFSQCKSNILERKRKRDINALTDTLAKNREILEKYKYSTIPFKVVDVFEAGEKW